MRHTGGGGWPYRGAQGEGGEKVGANGARAQPDLRAS